jgi:methionyl-tRNA formyltransferase
LIRNLDFCLLFAFGKKIPNDLLTLPRPGFINIHPSLLPKYRGPSPIAYPLIFGEKETGVTIIKMDDPSKFDGFKFIDVGGN